MDSNQINQHQMLTRSKRKKTPESTNLILPISNLGDIENSNPNIYFELSEEFLKYEEDEIEIKERSKRLKIDNYIHPEMRDFIIPDDESMEEDDDEDEDYIPVNNDFIYDSDNSELEIEITSLNNNLGNNNLGNNNLIANLDKSERELSEALASYINKRIDDLDEDTIDMLENKEEIFTTYQPKMQQFFLKLPSIEQNQILELENEIKKLNNEVTPLRYQLLQSNMDVKVKAIAMRKLNSLNSMDSSSGEYYKIQSYLDGLMKIPFGKYIDLPISSSNTSQEITTFMIKSNDILNEAVYGHQLAKSNILQTLGKWISNPSAKGSVFSILGPMGNGKTTLVKEGIAKMIQRPFEFISLGGATDSSFLDGHSYTYEGSMAGKIVEILKKTQCMNPVIYFDELDKVSQTPRGDEIINLLIHLTDFSQNDVFMDKYYSDIPLDLSKAVFIFSLNSLENLNPILRDRMQVIKTDKLEEKDKIIISQKYMIPKILKEVNLTDENIIIPEETIKFAISQYSVESGVRNLKRCYETLLEKINIWRLLNFSGNELTNLNFSTQVQKIFAKPISFPLTVTQDLLKKIMDEKAIEEGPPMMMYS